MSNEISCEGCESSSQCVSFVSFDSFARQLLFLRIAPHCPAVSAESRCALSGYIEPSTSARVRLREKPVFPGSDSLVGCARAAQLAGGEHTLRGERATYSCSEQPSLLAPVWKWRSRRSPLPSDSDGTNPTHRWCRSPTTKNLLVVALRQQSVTWNPYDRNFCRALSTCSS